MRKATSGPLERETGGVLIDGSFVTAPAALTLPLAALALALEARLDRSARHSSALSRPRHDQSAPNELGQPRLGVLSVLTLASRVARHNAHRPFVAYPGA
jgi:hypothetical protein